MTNRTICIAIGLLLLTGCEDPLKRAQQIEEPRVLGARLTDGENRASLTPGQPAALEVLLAGPAGPVADAGLTFELCEAAATERGVPTCSRAAFASGIGTIEDDAIALDVPGDARAGAQVVVLGVVCTSGVPEPDGEKGGVRCSGAESPLPFSLDATIAKDENSNRNPDLSELSVTVHGTPIPLEAPFASPGCVNTPRFAAGRKLEVTLDLGEASREPLAFGQVEALQLSHFSTTGRYERQYSFMRGGAASVRVTFESPRSGASKHYLVVRDERGGVSWASFSLCAE